MIIRIQDTVCCELHDSQLPDVVQLLGKDSFTFRLDQAQNHLNLVLPVHDYQVILEANDDRLAVLLVHLLSKLKQARFPCVYMVHTETDRIRVMEHVNIGRPILWISFNTGLDAEEWVIHYSSQHKKTSKHMAEVIVSHLSHDVATRMQSEPMKWKQMLSSLRTQSDKQFPRVRVTSPGFQAYNVDRIELIANSLAKAVISVYTDKPLLELTQALAVLEEKAQALFAPAVSEEAVIEESSETIESYEQAEPELELTPAPVFVSDKEPEPVSSSEQEELVSVSMQEASATRVDKRMSQSTAVFSMLRAHAQGVGTSEHPPSTSPTSSFMAYMNQLSFPNNKAQKQQQPYHILLQQHNLKKSVHEP